MLLNRMQPVPGGFACASCSCKTVDFRGKSPTEIQASLTDGVCGIFTADQLPHHRQLVGRARLAFRFAVVLSFLGFNVKPVAAAEGPLVHSAPTAAVTPALPSSSVASADSDVDGDAADRDDRPRRKRLFHRFRRKTLKGYVTGCPNW